MNPKMWRQDARRRSGIVLVSVVVVFTISLALFGIWAQAAIGKQRQLRGEQWRLQSVRLAEAGVRRAAARRAADPQYTEETWSVPADMLDGTHPAEVRIRIASAADGSTWSVEATAEYPAESLRRAQVTRRIEFLNPNSGNER